MVLVIVNNLCSRFVERIILCGYIIFLLRIIICYVKPYIDVQRKDEYYIEITTKNCLIIFIR